MRIQEICDLLKKELLNNGYEYGFYLDGVKYKPDMTKGYDEEFARALVNCSRVQAPSDTVREKVGTCIDVAVLMKTILADHGLSGKIWLLHSTQRNQYHSIFTFEAEGKVVYLELTPQSQKPWYGREIIYESEEALVSEYRENGWEITDVTDSVIIGERPEFMLSRLG